MSPKWHTFGVTAPDPTLSNNLNIYMAANSFASFTANNYTGFYSNVPSTNFGWNGFATAASPATGGASSFIEVIGDSAGAAGNLNDGSWHHVKLGKKLIGTGTQSGGLHHGETYHDWQCTLATDLDNAGDIFDPNDGTKYIIYWRMYDSHLMDAIRSVGILGINEWIDNISVHDVTHSITYSHDFNDGAGGPFTIVGTATATTHLSHQCIYLPDWNLSPTNQPWIYLDLPTASPQVSFEFDWAGTPD